MRSYLKLYKEKPLLFILIAGGFFRLLAVIFSKGFGMQDDHFLVIEAAQSWVDHTDYNRWLPIQGNTTPPGHSFLYPGLHYLFLLFLKWINITTPQSQMYVIRFLHAVYSMSVIYFGYKIAEKLSDKKSAIQVGLLLSLYWFMPFYSVRNLVEIVCIPLLMLNTLLITNYELRITNSNPQSKIPTSLLFLLMGFLCGIAFSIRYQTIIFTGGIGLVLLYKKQWKETILLIIGVLLSIVIFEGGIDYFVWGYPFAELREYIRYNLANAYNYITLPWYHYILFLPGFLLPPVSIFLFIGFFRSWRKHLLLFLPSFLFLLFHSYFPNKQERFILTIIPFIIILGIIGWNDYLSNTKLQTRNLKLIKGCWVFFWIINLLMLPLISTWYTKKARVESMVYLSKYKNVETILQEGDTKLPPRYYLGQWVNTYDITDNASFVSVQKDLSTKERKNLPKFVLFYDNKNIETRVNQIKSILPGIKYETTIEPGLMDKILFKMNPKNSNQTIVIYKNTD